jgi:hypothetical protein
MRIDNYSQQSAGFGDLGCLSVFRLVSFGAFFGAHFPKIIFFGIIPLRLAVTLSEGRRA